MYIKILTMKKNINNDHLPGVGLGDIYIFFLLISNEILFLNEYYSIISKKVNI